MTDADPHKRATELHTQAAGWQQRNATQASVFQAYARKLNSFNDTQVRLDLPVPALQDPRDILTHVLALAAGMKSSGEVPPMNLVDALGAQVIALGMAVARVEDGRLDTGDDVA